jgi:hypothetical protein
MVTEPDHPLRPMSAVPPAEHLSRIRQVLRFVVRLLPFVVLVLLTLAQDSPPAPENSPTSAYLKILSSDFWYAQAVGKPQPPSRHVAVVAVGRDMPAAFAQHSTLDPKQTLSLPCRRRAYLADLFKSLTALSPKVVVVDMWLETEACSDQPSTELLLDEVNQFSGRVPVVFGVGSFNPTQILTNWPAEFAGVMSRQPPLRSTELVMRPIIHPGSQTNRQITEGMTEVDFDNRQIPLSWAVYDSFASVGTAGQPVRRDTLAIAAVRAFDPSPAQILRRIGALRPDGTPQQSTQSFPYTNFLREEELPIARSVDLICAAPPTDFWKENCSQSPHSAANPEMFKDKVVVVGLAGTGDDIHPSVIGVVPGMILQANYVESLLDGRVFQSVPSVIQIVAGLLWLGILFWLSSRFAAHPVWVSILSVVAALLSYFLIHFSVLHFGYYTQMLVPIILSAVVLNISRQVESMITPKEE